MSDLPISMKSTTQQLSSATKSSTDRSNLHLILWLVTSFLSTMVLLGVAAPEVLRLALQSNDSTVKLILSENLRGSPAIGAPQSNEDDQYYEWNVVSNAIQKPSAVKLLLSDSLLGSPSIGAPALEGDETDDVYDDDEFYSYDESVEIENPGDEDKVKLWNKYQSSSENSMEESSDDSEDDLIDSTAVA